MTTVSSIRTLKPNVTREQALRTFASMGVSGLYWRVRSGPLQRIADAYVPFWLFRVRYQMNRAMHTRLFAIDAVNGSLDLFQFPALPLDDRVMEIQTRNRIEPSLDQVRAATLLREKVLRVIFQQGFFKLREPKLEVIPETDVLYLPYWLAFHGHKIVRCRVLDAVRRRIEGAKASAFFEEWLAA